MTDHFALGPKAPIMMPAGVLLGAILIGTVLAIVGADGAAPEDGITSVRDLKILAAPLSCWVIMHYWMFAINGVHLGLWDGDGDPFYKEKCLYLGSRCGGNLHEQRLLFIVPLFMYAIFVNPEAAAALTWLTIFYRAAWPCLNAYMGQFSLLVEFATQPTYNINFFFISSTLLKVGPGTDILKDICDVSPVLLIPYMFAHGIVQFLVDWALIPKIYAEFIKARVKNAMKMKYGIYASLSDEKQDADPGQERHTAKQEEEIQKEVEKCVDSKELKGLKGTE